MNNLGLVLAEQGNFNEALMAIEKALAQNPQQAYYLSNKGYVLTQLNQLAQAEEALTTSLKYDEKNGFAYRNLGILATKKGDISTALANFEKSVALDSTVTNIYSYLALAYQAAKQPEKACQAWQLAKQHKETLNVEGIPCK